MSGKPEKELRLPVQREQLHVPEIEGELASLKINNYPKTRNHKRLAF